MTSDHQFPDGTAAGWLDVYALFAEQARLQPDALALEIAGPPNVGDAGVLSQHSYADVLGRVDALAGLLQVRGIARGDRVAVVSENRLEYLCTFLAAARIGAIVACQNWRLAPGEMQHCLDLVEPSLILQSGRFDDLLDGLETHGLPRISYDDGFDDLLANAPAPTPVAVQPEDGLLILYTSGTTGLPKAAVISQRAEVARMMVLRLDLGVTPQDGYLAWSPMFHMGGTEHCLSELMMGGFAIVTDGLDVAAMAAAIARHRLGWLLLVPATIDPLLAELKAQNTVVKHVGSVGCMADLVPLETIAEISRVLDAPFFNSFGATETGLPPASGHLLPVGGDLSDLSKRQSSYCAFRLVDPDGNDVPPGEAGEGAVRGPTLFSGYWAADEINREQFQNGWFRMGDLFTRDATGGIQFVGRAKYLIKSGGENIYPAEIERILLADARVEDAIVIRQPDPKWGEVPVALVARRDGSLTAEDLATQCRAELAGYKQPKQILFVEMSDFARSETGKIIREAMERLVEEKGDSVRAE